MMVASLHLGNGVLSPIPFRNYQYSAGLGYDSFSSQVSSEISRLVVRGSELGLASYSQPLRNKYVLFEVHRLTAASFQGLPPPYKVPAHSKAFVSVCSLWGAPDLAEFCLFPSFLTRQFYLESLWSGRGKQRRHLGASPRA